MSASARRGGRGTWGGILKLPWYAPTPSGAFEQGYLVAGLEGGDGLLPVALLALFGAETSDLAGQGHGVHLEHLHLEQGLDRLLDLALVGAGGDLEGHLVVCLQGLVGLLRDHRNHDDI